MHIDWTIADAGRLCDALERTEVLETLSNAEVATLVEDHLWTVLPVLTPASDLLAEVIARLRQGAQVSEGRA